ncbi:hypothetical protein VTN77DRAFT_6636 [Rasamsonia byssochlamydoides]|uniref:uncharacterized protein n=1 Tax=Rasamsonia byssochlamydoides TaxID=89139 RepID=UPI003741ED34
MAAYTQGLNGRRNFSILSVHTTFPATLYKFQLQRESQRYDRCLRDYNSDYSDGVEIAKNGLVCPGVTSSGSNGARFSPNTAIFQQLARMHHEYYLEFIKNSGKDSGEPVNADTEFFHAIPHQAGSLPPPTVRTEEWLRH